MSTLSVTNIISSTLDSISPVGKQTTWIPATAWYFSSGPSTGNLVVNGATIPYIAFDSSIQEYAFASIAMPKNWNLGNLQAQFYWAHPSTSTNFGVSWGFGAAAFGDSDAFDNLYSGTTVVDTGGTTNDIFISPESGNIDPGNIQQTNDILSLRLYREAANVNDTLAVDAYFIGVKITYTISTGNDN